MVFCVVDLHLFLAMLPNLGFLLHSLFIFYEYMAQFKIAFTKCFPNSKSTIVAVVIKLCDGKNKLQRYTKLWDLSILIYPQIINFLLVHGFTSLTQSAIGFKFLLATSYILAISTNFQELIL
jgi:hypothetical protein